MRRLLLLVVAVLAVAGAGPSLAVESDTGLGIRLLEAPTDRRDDPRALVYVIDHVAPGTSFTRDLEVSNDTSEPMDVDVYPVGSEISGSSFVPLAERTPNELSGWVTVSPDRVRLAPREKRSITVAVTVPRDASEGERYAAVMAESAALGVDGVVVNARVGIRMYLSVGPGGEPASDFTIDDLRAGRDETGRPVVEATVTNTGGRALDMSGTLSLTNGPGGLSAGPFPVELGTTLGVGTSQPVRVVLDGALPAGPWQTRIDLRSGLLERAAEGTLTFPDAAGEVGPRVTAEPVPLAKDPSIVVPLAIGLLALAVLLLWALWRRRARDDRDDADPQTQPVVPTARRSPDEAVRS